LLIKGYPRLRLRYSDIITELNTQRQGYKDLETVIKAEAQKMQKQEDTYSIGDTEAMVMTGLARQLQR
jgi:hypothetical protein